MKREEARTRAGRVLERAERVAGERERRDVWEAEALPRMVGKVSE